MCISASFFVQKPVKTGSDHIAPSWNLKEREGVKLHERQDFQCPAESGTELYAPNCDSSGSRSSAGNRKFLYKCHDN